MCAPLCRNPVVPQLEQPANLRVNVDVDEPLAHVGVLAQRLAAAVVGLAVVEDAVNNPVAPNLAPAPVFQFQVGGGDFPALVFAADEVAGRHANVVKIDDVLDAGTRAGLAGRRQ